HVPAVLDPVLASTSGRALLETDAIAAMKRDLMPLCRVVTPNLIELALLVGAELAMDEGSALQQGQRLLADGPQSLLIKGGHASGPRSTDILLRSDREPVRFDMPRLAGTLRGTGCMMASAIAAHFANARSLEDSVREGKLFVFKKLEKGTRPMPPSMTRSASRQAT
ncbi:bifunctional hydroxymethylpyrimidine kinase/phosphomethylpyrimidine kinase, partial [Mesorhizobium sp. M7A.F.Ca.ET.027.03.2.1]